MRVSQRSQLDRATSERMLDALCAPTGAITVPTLVVAAHPDDESIALGGRLHRLSDVFVVHVTDGAPIAPDRGERDPQRIAYRERRAGELAEALRLAGIDDSERRSFALPGGTASAVLAPLASRLAQLLRELRPALVVTHAYEGGHPDHDATAFAVHAAVRLARARCTIVEAAGYHGASGAPTWGAFHEHPGARVREVALDADAIARRRRLFACHASQAEVLARFPLDLERFRLAPGWDFRQPPHAGTLLYEREGGARGDVWRQRAAKALAELGLPG